MRSVPTGTSVILWEDAMIKKLERRMILVTTAVFASVLIVTPTVDITLSSLIYGSGGMGGGMVSPPGGRPGSRL